MVFFVRLLVIVAATLLVSCTNPNKGEKYFLKVVYVGRGVEVRRDHSEEWVSVREKMEMVGYVCLNPTDIVRIPARKLLQVRNMEGTYWWLVGPVQDTIKRLVEEAAPDKFPR